jgi:hypothetical protein
MQNKVTGQGYISAQVVQDSTHPETHTRITTLELEYPRFIHSEFMTHRMLSKNSASSRAIPVAKMHEHIREVPQAPIHWGKNQPGMQAQEELPPTQKSAAQLVWSAARDSALSYSNILNQTGLHKQAANRITEPFMQMKVVVTATEWDNFFWLRDHRDAQPEIRELAQVTKRAMEASMPLQIGYGCWHLPYIERRLEGGEIHYYSQEVPVTLEQAIRISASCCAQVSYRKLDEGLARADKIYQQLIESEPVHASPVEHQATPIDVSLPNYPSPSWEPHGVTHVRADHSLWSGNFRWWTQNRQLLTNHTKWS